jgi:hypothetical protein
MYWVQPSVTTGPATPFMLPPSSQLSVQVVDTDVGQFGLQPGMV